MMAFAERLTLRANEITRDDIEGLRAHGFGDAEILDIALAAAARNFYSAAFTETSSKLAILPAIRRDASVEGSRHGSMEDGAR